MANIKDYPNAGEPYEDSDKIIGTENSDQTVAKNFSLLAIWQYFVEKIKTGVQEILFNTNASPTDVSGTMSFDGVSFNLRDNIAGTSIQIGKEIVIDVYNNNGVTLSNFTVVRYGPAVSGYPSAVRAQADTVSNANSFGVCTHDIGVGLVGKVTTQGVAGGDTSMWNANDILYLSATVAGEMTNVEQAILKPVARVLVADTEVNGGSIYVFQQGIINITAVGQAIGIDESQLLTATPAALAVYDANIFEQNVIVDQVGTGPYTASMRIASPGAGGLYRVSFNTSIVGTANTIHYFEVYFAGTPTGIEGTIDLTNNNIDSGSCAFSVVTEDPLAPLETIEIYAYTLAGTSTITASTTVFNIQRIGVV
jgi:hypothetical protein